MELKKENRGGKRAGAGRKKLNYETKIVFFRVKAEFVDDIKKMVKDYNLLKSNKQ
jgi:hypothetical protein